MRVQTIILFVVLLVPSTIFAASAELAKLIDEHWEYTMREYPEYATQAGDHRFNDKLAEVSLAAEERREKERQQWLAKFEVVEKTGLTGDDAVNCAIKLRDLRDGANEYRYQTHLTPITGRTGFHIEFPDLRKQIPLATTKDFDNYIARLRAFGAVTDGNIELLRAGVKAGVTQPAVILEGYRDSIAAQIISDPTKSLFYEPFRKLPQRVPDGEHDRLRAAAKAAITEVIVPAYERFLKFMEEEYVPNCRTAIGASALPNGRDFYRFRIKHFTTLDTTPEAVHQQGLAEVTRVRAEMQKIMDGVGFKGDLPAFTAKINSDPQFQAATPEELMRKAALILKKADGELPKLFGKLPRMPYGLREVPSYIAPKTTSAYYMRPSGDGTVAGFYYLNTYNLPARPTYALESLSLHEAVPGHHLQLALQQELENLPEFRKFGGATAFIEGWGLYSESLGDEMGFYEDPYSDFGRLSMEMWRSCRLVVDTGIHFLGWTREQAIAFMQQNSAGSDHNIRAEVDRYIGWPGQAVAYKTGELKIQALRKEAETALGEKFDLRAFHDVVLGAGAVPLDVLEGRVKAWIAEQQ